LNCNELFAAAAAAAIAKPLSLNFDLHLLKTFYSRKVAFTINIVTFFITIQFLFYNTKINN
jgi:hypothetical protein